MTERRTEPTEPKGADKAVDELLKKDAMPQDAVADERPKPPGRDKAPKDR
jgi:hypothetical protein